MPKRDDGGPVFPFSFKRTYRQMDGVTNPTRTETVTSYGVPLVDYMAIHCPNRPIENPEAFANLLIAMDMETTAADADPLQAVRLFNQYDARIRYDWAEAMIAEKRRREGGDGK